MNRMIPSVWLGRAAWSNELERFIQDFWSQDAPASGAVAHNVGGPALNVFETADGFEVELEVPGMKLEDIEVLIEGRDLSVRGERKSALPEGGSWQRRERFHGGFARSLRLPVDVDAQRVQARLHQGVLSIRLPKAESAKPRKIQIQSPQPVQQ